VSSTRAGDVDDPVAFFLRDVQLHGKSERTREEYERLLSRYRSFLAERDAAPAEAAHRDCTAFVHELRTDPALAESTVAIYAAYLHRFYAYMTQVGAFDANPMALVMEELDEQIDPDPTRREVTVPEMRSFLAGVTHPLERALIVTLLKTGMRVGELCNLDVRDLSLTGADGYDLGERPTLEGRDDSVFVPAAPSVGETHNGEERTASNKRKRDTVIPVDD